MIANLKHAARNNGAHIGGGDFTREECAAAARALEERDELRSVLLRAQRLMKEALPKFNWGASALDANAIALLNEVPGEVDAALKGGK